MKRYILWLRDCIFPEGYDIRVSAFNILAACGLLVSVMTAFYNLAIGLGAAAFLGSIAGAAFSLGVMIYTRKSGNYRKAMILTVLIIFIGLFTLLFFVSGGYRSGVPSFFIFGVVFTAFMLDGKIMRILAVTEMAWYAFLCLYAYYNPLSVYLAGPETTYVMDVIVCETVVSISLAVAMHLQIRLYRKNQEELNAAILAAKEANQAKSDFLAKMSHDIRTPLNTILAMNELIVSHTSSARIREWVADSNVSGRILLSLIDDMLDLTRIEAGKMELVSRPWNTGRLFSEEEKIWRAQAEKAKLTFLYDLDEDVPAFLLGDEYAIRKILNNLLSNAVKYTKTGSVRLDISWEDSLVLRVSDTGIGIAPEYLDRIFKPFERGVQDIYRETSGSGLGLAIVKELVDAMEGSVECESIHGEGTTFTVKLPVKEYVGENSVPDDIKHAILSPSSQIAAPSARILVVDDNAYNRKVVLNFLEPALIQTDEVESGFEALEMIDIRDYDLIFMDLRMPKMDGIETLKKMKEEFPDFHTPVIALTADIMNGIQENLTGCGFAGFLSKPVSSVSLFDAVTKFIPDKIILLNVNREPLTDLELYEDMAAPFGIDLSVALEYNAGNASEFLARARLFEEYADEGIRKLSDLEPFETYYLQVHSLKSIARGVGASLLASLAETVERRKDDSYSRIINPGLIEEYKRVRQGLSLLIGDRNEPEQGNGDR